MRDVNDPEVQEGMAILSGQPTARQKAAREITVQLMKTVKFVGNITVEAAADATADQIVEAADSIGIYAPNSPLSGDFTEATETDGGREINVLSTPEVDKVERDDPSTHEAAEFLKDLAEFQEGGA